MSTDETFKEKLQTISFGAPRKPREIVDRVNDVKHVELISESTGGVGGHETYHADGTWDGSVNAAPITTKSNIH